MQCFDLIDLFAESRLGDVQPVGGPSEIQLLRQNKDCLQMTHLNPREHGSKPLSPSGRDWLITLHLVKEREGKKKYQKELLAARGLRCRSTERLTAVGFGWHALSHLAI